MTNWWPGKEARRLTELEAKNVHDREIVAEQLRLLDEALAKQDLTPDDRAELRARRTDMEHHRTGVLDTERTITAARQNLLLQSTARATWAAAAAALSPVLWEIARVLLRTKT